MIISLDYDDTYTEDPNLWGHFIDQAKRNGHEVVIVTFRDPSLPLPDIGLPVYYTSYKAKRQFMDDLGIPISVWIDDSPETIFRDSSWTFEQRAEWKKLHFDNIRA